MNRRDFLRGLLGTAALATPAVKYILPPIGGWRNVNGVYRTGTIGEIAYFEFREAQSIRGKDFKLGPGMLHIGDGIHVPIQSVSVEFKKRQIHSAYRGAVRAIYPDYDKVTLKGSFKFADASPEAIRKLIDTASYFEWPTEAGRASLKNFNERYPKR